MGEAEARRLFSESLSSGSQSSEFIDLMRMVLKRVDGWPTIKQMAELAGVSVRTLQRRLTAEGQTYAQLIDETRAEFAVELLRDTEDTLAEIAIRLGYSEPNNFARAFKRWTGMTPKQLRDNGQDP